MQVLIPHPTELISLTRLQKKLIQDNYNSCCLITRSLPLWIEIPDSKQTELSKSELKTLASKIQKIEINSPEVSSLKTDIFCPVKIEIGGKQINSQLKLIKIHNPAKFELKKISTEEINFPLCLKIFRIGNKTELPEQNAVAIQDSVWKKL